MSAPVNDVLNGTAAEQSFFLGTVRSQERAGSAGGTSEADLAVVRALADAGASLHVQGEAAMLLPASDYALATRVFGQRGKITDLWMWVSEALRDEPAWVDVAFGHWCRLWFAVATVEEDDLPRLCLRWSFGVVEASEIVEAPAVGELDAHTWWGATPTGRAVAARETIRQAAALVGSRISAGAADRAVQTYLCPGDAWDPMVAACAPQARDGAAVEHLYACFEAPDTPDGELSWSEIAAQCPTAPSAVLNRVLRDAATMPVEAQNPVRVLNRVRAAAPGADPNVVAGLVLADPARWCPLVLPDDTGADRARTVWDLVGEQVSVWADTAAHGEEPAPGGPTARVLAGGPLDTSPEGAVFLDGVALVCAGGILDRLIWLGEHIRGAGAGQAFTAACRYPDVEVRRLVAANRAAPRQLLASLMEDPDPVVRRHAGDTFAAVLGDALA